MLWVKKLTMTEEFPLWKLEKMQFSFRTENFHVDAQRSYLKENYMDDSYEIQCRYYDVERKVFTFERFNAGLDPEFICNFIRFVLSFIEKGEIPDIKSIEPYFNE